MTDTPENDTRPIVLQLRAIDVAMACERVYYINDSEHHAQRLREAVASMLEAVENMQDILEVE